MATCPRARSPRLATAGSHRQFGRCPRPPSRSGVGRVRASWSAPDLVPHSSTKQVCVCFQLHRASFLTPTGRPQPGRVSETRNRAERCQGCTGTPVSSFTRNYTRPARPTVFMACPRFVHATARGGLTSRGPIAGVHRGGPGRWERRRSLSGGRHGSSTALRARPTAHRNATASGRCCPPRPQDHDLQPSRRVRAFHQRTTPEDRAFRATRVLRRSLRSRRGNRSGCAGVRRRGLAVRGRRGRGSRFCGRVACGRTPILGRSRCNRKHARCM